MSTIDCLESGNADDPCRGRVEYRWPGYGEKSWPRCERHGRLRLEREEENLRRNSPDGPGAPWGFDEMDAGERWEAA